MPATTIQLCLYDMMHRCKIPHHYSPLLSSGPDKENIKEWCRIKECHNVLVLKLVISSAN